MCFNMLLRSLKVFGGLCVTQTNVIGTQVSDLFQCQIKYAFIHAKHLVIMFIMFPIIKLRNYTVPGPNKPQTLNYY